MEFEIPDSWTLENFVDYTGFLPTGVKPFKGETEYYSTGSIKETENTPEGIYNYTNRPSRANRFSEVGDVLQARMKGTNKALLINENLRGKLFSTGFLQLRPDPKKFNNKLLYYFINSDLFLKQKDELATGSTQEALTDSKAKEIVIPTPPIHEQKKIAAKLDRLMERMNANKERLDKIPQILKRFRQSVLSAAVSGKLTQDKREGDKEWGSKTLGELITKIQSGKSIRCEERPPKIDEIGIIKVSAVSWSEFNENESKTITDKKYFNKNYSIKTGDFLFSRANTIELIAAVVIVKEINKSLMLSDKILRFDFNDFVKPYWVLYCLRSEDGRKQIEELATGNQQSMMNISQDSIKKITIPVPSIKEQEEIVKRVNELFAFADKIEARYTKAKQQLDKLPQCILAKAFRGELV